jgi:MFS family permease
MSSRAIRRVIPPLFREDPRFARFWAGQAISLIGDQVTVLALPLTAVLVLHASAEQMGYLFTAALLPNLLFSVLAGAWVDRHGHRRQAMILADLGRTALIVTLPLAWAIGRLTLGQLYVVAFLGGSLELLFWIAESSLFQAMVSRDRYLQANGLIHGSRAFANLSGPTLGGFLVQLLGAPVALLADAASFIVSALSLATIKPPEPAPEPTQSGSLLAGVRYIVRSPIMRSALGTTATVNFFNLIFSTLYVLYAVRVLHVRPAILGLVMATGAIGGLIAAGVSSRLGHFLGIGRMIVIGSFIFPASLLFVPAAGGSMALVVVLLLIYEVAAGFGVMVFDIGLNSIFAALVPSRLRSRVSGAYTVVNYGVRPVGAFIAGVLGTVIGIRPTLWLAAIGGLTSGLWLLPSPIARMRELPKTDDGHVPAGPVLGDR